MSVEYVNALQEAARSGKPVVHEDSKPKEALDPNSPSSSDLPYHSAITEAIQAERAKPKVEPVKAPATPVAPVAPPATPAV